jgi:hypothetical protein
MTDQEEKDEKARWQRLENDLAGADIRPIPDEVLQLARAVAGVRDSTMTCEECQSWLPAYVDAEVGGLTVGQMYPEVKRHLDLCPDCEAEYLEMLELALAEDAGELSVPDKLPVPDLTFLPRLSLPDYVRSLAEEIISATRPHLVGDLRAITDIFFERVATLDVQFTLGPGFAPALGFGAGEVPEALEVLAATYLATHSLTEALSSKEIGTQARAGQLQETLRQKGEEAARDVGLSRQQAQAFAEKYAELVVREPEALQNLATRQAR